jgi:plastocyanin
MKESIAFPRFILTAGLALAFAVAAAGSSPVAAQTTTDVAVRDDFFEPASVTVPSGATVRWTNRGQNLHTVTSGTGMWTAATLTPGATHSVTFANSGTYAYHCEFHPGMQGQVVVTQEGSPGPNPTAAPPPGGGTNLALGKRVAASSAVPGRPPSAAVDGHLATFWRSRNAFGGAAAAAAIAESGAQLAGLTDCVGRPSHRARCGSCGTGG